MNRSLVVFITMALLGFLFVSGCNGGSGSDGAAGPAGVAGQNGQDGATGPTGTVGPAGPTLPSITSTNPADLNTSIPLDAVIQVVFSKPMSAATITAGSFTVTAGSTPIAGSISYNSGSRTAYFDPTTALPAFTYFTVTLTTGIQDTSGNALTQNYSWSFTTGGSLTVSRLYVLSSANQIAVFNRPRSGDMTSLPDRLVSGASTSLNNPWGGIWLDSASNRLYVSSFGYNHILVFNNASTVNGNTAPSRIISGATTSLHGPVGIWLDAANDRLYVANWSANSIVIFSSVSSTSGNIVPSRIISGPSTSLSTPFSLWLDSAKDQLYVSNPLANRITVYNNASTTSGDIAPSRVISGPTTSINFVYGIWLDSASDSLYAANFGNNKVLVFSNASTATGDIAPARIISGTNTGLTSPAGIRLDSATDRLYIGNYNGSKVSIFKNASSANGNIAPDIVIPFTNPTGLWLDTDQ